MNIWILTKKEIKSYFFSPMIYLLAAFFLFLMGLIFFNTIVYSQKGSLVSLTDAVLRPIFANMNFLFLMVIPILTMRSFSEEKRDRTLELLLTSSLRDLEIIIGKFLSAFSVVLFMVSLTTIFPIILGVAGYSNWAVLLTGYLGTLLNALCYLSVGIFISSLSENQIVSALITFCILIFFMLLAQSVLVMDNFILALLVKNFSMAAHFEPFTRGVIDLMSVVYFLFFIGFMVFLTKKSLESRNW